MAELDLAYEAFARSLMSPPETDPHNPWPVGCDWWHRHNDMWRKAARLRELQDSNKEGGL